MLAERSRLARDLHDVLAHSLSVLAVQLEAARLTAITTAAGADLVGQIAHAHKLTCIGVLNARQALATLRDDELPGPDSLPGLVSDTAAALGIPITLEVDGTPGALEGDGGLTLYRVVQEALANVAKHAGRGSPGDRAARLGGPAASRYRSWTAAATGPGRACPSGGFGLTSMAERAALKGGRLRAGPADDGFAVRLWLPAWPSRGGAAAMSADAVERRRRGMPARRRVRVLVADDQKVVRDGLTLLLGLLPGIEVIGTAVDGADAVRQAAATEPDVVLMDLSMPNGDGVEATRGIVRRSRARVVVLTAYSDDDSVFAALRAGARGFLPRTPAPARSSGRCQRSAPGTPSWIRPCSAGCSRPCSAASRWAGVPGRGGRPAGSGARRAHPARDRGARRDRGGPVQRRDRRQVPDLRRDGQEPHQPPAGQDRGAGPRPAGRLRVPARLAA